MEDEDPDLPVSAIDLDGNIVLGRQESTFKQIAIRPIVYEERWIDFEQRFFCDRQTEKRVELEVKSLQTVSSGPCQSNTALPRSWTI